MLKFAPNVKPHLSMHFVLLLKFGFGNGTINILCILNITCSSAPCTPLIHVEIAESSQNTFSELLFQNVHGSQEGFS